MAAMVMATMTMTMTMMMLMMVARQPLRESDRLLSLLRLSEAILRE